MLGANSQGANKGKVEARGYGGSRQRCRARERGVNKGKTFGFAVINRQIPLI
jgi:hypothetical protein